MNNMENKLYERKRTMYGVVYSYLRPSQTRDIPLKHGSNAGVFPSLKVERLRVYYESQLERDFYYLLDHDPNCVDFQPQPWKLSYIDKKGQKRWIFPDCWAVFTDGRQFLFEIKTEKKYRELVTNENWKLRVDAIHSFCKKQGWTYQVITEKKIECVRLNNIKDCLNAAKHYSPSQIGKNVRLNDSRFHSIGIFDSRLKGVLDDSPKILDDVVVCLEPMLALERAEIITLLKYKLYNFHVYFDWDVPIANANISSKGSYPVPTYALPEVILNDGEYSESILVNSNNSIKVRNEMDETFFNERYSLISPIVNRFGNRAKKSEVFSTCEDVGLTEKERAYRWYRLWKKGGDNALYPKNKKNDKSHLKDIQVEELLVQAVNTWQNDGEWRQAQSAYEDFCNKCKEHGLQPAGRSTFYRRIDKLPFVEKHGKHKPRSQRHISRGLKDTYREARHPCCVIQMDHSKLDIRCVDSLTNRDHGRVWCTIGVDAFSRSIWTYHLSFEDKSSESVMNAFAKGLLFKNKLPEWRMLQSNLLKDGYDPDSFTYSCGGFPTMIQVDNGKDFRAEVVEDLAMKLNITYEFRPVKEPDFGGFIESIWDTINDEIRNSKLPGRVYSLPKSRESNKKPRFIEPPGYDARITSKWTLEEFEAWFFKFIVTKYSTDLRAGQLHSPEVIWKNGLIGENLQPMGGIPRFVDKDEYDRLLFECKQNHESTLSEKGFLSSNVWYTSEWLRQARKDGILKDGRVYPYKISRDDVRYAYIIDPKEDRVEVLVAYNYNGDDRIRDFILQGVGKIQGYEPFPISLKMVNYAKKLIGKSSGDDGVSVMYLARKEIAKAKPSKNAQKLFQEFGKNKDGREIIEATTVVMEMDESSRQELLKSGKTQKPKFDPKKKILRNKDWFEDLEDEEPEEMPSTWEDARKLMEYSKYKEQ